MTTHPTAAGSWSRPLRTLHLLLAIAVTLQLFIGSFMRDPHPGRPDSFGFMTHEVIGATILALIVLHWAWVLTHPAEGARHLFPWTGRGLQQVVDELWQAVRWQRLPSGGARHAGLAGFIHGLGLLAVTATVALGASFFIVRAAGAGLGMRVPIKNVHDVFAIVVWVYWGGHLFTTIMHSLLHQPVWRTMFNLHARPNQGTELPHTRFDA